MKPILAFLVPTILAPFVVSVAVEITKPYLPDALPLVLRWLAMLAEWPGTPFVIVGGLGVLFGLWLDVFADWFDRRYPLTKAAHAKNLASEASVIGHRLEALRSGALPWENHDELVALTLLLVRRLQAIGVVFPQDATAEDKADLWFLGRQFRSIAPALAKGDIRAANELIAITMWSLK